MKIKLLLFCCLFVSFYASAQKVGLVLSGGGAKGLAHIGILKALEEQNIPIDYITGTSMGGLVGGMYASSYSPSEIEYIAESADFQSWANGSFTSNYQYYYQKKAENASIVGLGLGIDSGYKARLHSNLVSDIPLNFALFELAAQASVNADFNFDSLLIPFRCMVSDVFSQESIALKEGSLSEALRATMTVPFVFRPIKINNRYVFDGGLYNNFPVDVMKKDFAPDVIIAVNVSAKNFEKYPFANDEELVNKLFNYLVVSKTDSTMVPPNGVYIQPNCEGISSLAFNSATALIKIGYDAAMLAMPEIKAKIAREVSRAEKKAQRLLFQNRKAPVRFNALRFSGINNRQKVYLRNVIKQNYKNLSIYEIKNGYSRVVADNNFQAVFPKIIKASPNIYDFELEVKPERNLQAEVGGNISSRPINTVFLGLQYSYLNVYSLTVATDIYIGRFYESGKANVRIDLPTRRPIYLDVDFTYNHWDYFNGSDLYIKSPNLTFVDQVDRSLVFSAGTPLGKNGKLMAKIGGLNTRDLFSQNNVYTEGDTLDRSVFNAFKYSLAYEKNNLDAKQFATAGMRSKVAITYFSGEERYLPGSTSQLNINFEDREWFKFVLQYDKYYKVSNSYRISWMTDMVLSNQPLFSSYRSTLLAASAFNPIIDSKTLLLENYRALNYAAVGLRNIFLFKNNFQWRLEGYLFQPIHKINNESSQLASLSKVFEEQYFALTSAFVYKSKIGPISGNISYYEESKKELFFLINVGYLLFQNRPTE